MKKRTKRSYDAPPIDRWSWLIAATIFGAPILFLDVLPLTDLGGHLGRFAVQLDEGRTPQLAQWFSFHWHLIPNLGVDLLVEAIAPLIGLEFTVRLAVAISCAASAAGIMLLSRAVHGRVTPGAILALPFTYGFAFQFGFLNFNLSLGLALILAVSWIRLERRPSIQRWGVLAIYCSALWVCHLVGWAFFCIIAGSRELVRQLQSGRTINALVRTCLVLSSAVVPIFLGIIFGPDTSDHAQTGMFFNWPDKLYGLLAALRDQWQTFDLFSIGFVMAALVWMWSSRAMKLDKGLALSALILSISTVLLPHRVFGSDLADIRLIGPTLILALVAPRSIPGLYSEASRVLYVAALSFAGVRLAYNCLMLWERSDQLKADLEVVSDVPRGAQLLTFRVRYCDGPNQWAVDWRTHLSGYALARRRAFSNEQWQIPGAQLLTVHNTAVEPYMSEPSAKVATRSCGVAKDIRNVTESIPSVTTHLWVIWPANPQPLKGWRPVRQSGESMLYVRDDH